MAYVSTPTEHWKGIDPEVVLTEWAVEQVERLLLSAERIADALERIAAEVAYTRERQQLSELSVYKSLLAERDLAERRFAGMERRAERGGLTERSWDRYREYDQAAIDADRAVSMFEAAHPGVVELYRRQQEALHDAGGDDE